MIATLLPDGRRLTVYPDIEKGFRVEGMLSLPLDVKTPGHQDADRGIYVGSGGPI